MAASGKPVVDFYLDTACPWSWRTSVWMREVQKVRDVDVHWKFFSLEMVNKKNDPNMPRPGPGHLESRNTFRTMVLARRKYGDEAVNKLYEAFGTRKHEEKRISMRPGAALHREGRLLPEPARRGACRPDDRVGVPVRAHGDQREGRVRRGLAGHQRQRAGFGPVLIPVPTGEEAGELWDHVSAMSTKGYFFELSDAHTIHCSSSSAIEKPLTLNPPLPRGRGGWG